jgi:oligopeptide transport system permease protein
MMSSWIKLFFKNKTASASLIYLALISFMALAAPYITQYSYEAQNIMEKLQGPSLQHWMGTDTLGRDLFSRVVYGARMSMSVGLCTALFGLVVGTSVGAIAGYFGSWIDLFLMSLVDLLYIFPAPLLAILLTLFFGRGFVGILIAIGITSWITQARLVRVQVLQARAMPYVEAAQSVGLGHSRIIMRHILPNILAPILVSLTVQIPTNIMTESFLSFIGLGLQPPHSSWGTLANEGFRAIQSYPHLIIFPGAVLFITMLAFSYLGDGVAKGRNSIVR